MQDIKAQLKKVIQDLYGLDFDPDLTPSPDNINADYSSNAPLKLAKDLHKSPMEIAKELEEVAKNTFFKDNFRLDRPRRIFLTDPTGSSRRDGSAGDPVYDVEGGLAGPEKGIFATPPGFLNFALPDEYLQAAISELNADYKSDEYQGQTVICEFSDPNPFKVLHVGHLYTSIVGDSIARLYEYAGAKVIRANFGGDVGLHVAKTMYILMRNNPDDLKIEDIARCYVEGTAAYDDDETAHQEITKLNKEIYEINAAGPVADASTSVTSTGDVAGGTPSRAPARMGEAATAGPVENTKLTDLYWKGRELSYQYFDQFYDSIGVHFDKYYPESTVAGLGLAKVKEELEKGVYEYSDGAVIFNGDKYGLHTRVFINKEGVPTYEAKDVGLIFTKWQDYHFDKSIVITGNEQLDYMKVVLKSVEQYAPDLVEKTTHLTHGLVKLPGNVKMSSRKGNFLKAVDVLAMVRDALKSEYDSDDNLISLAATKYAFLKYKMGGDIIFDPKESVKMTGNSGPYLLYSAVRAKKILTKSHVEESNTSAQGGFRSAAARGLAPAARGDGPAGRDPGVEVFDSSERSLAKKLLEYQAVLHEAVAELAPHKVANYLYELAQTFSRFYENCEVIGSEQETERLELVRAYLNTMTHGLSILGISIPEEM